MKGAETKNLRSVEGRRGGKGGSFVFLINHKGVKGAVFRGAIAIDKFQLSAGSGGKFLAGNLLTQNLICESRREEAGSSNDLISDKAADVFSLL